MQRNNARWLKAGDYGQAFTKLVDRETQDLLGRRLFQLALPNVQFIADVSLELLHFISCILVLQKDPGLVRGLSQSLRARDSPDSY